MNNRLLGISYILISALFYGSYGVWSKLMMGEFGVFSQAWSRGLLLLSLVLVVGVIAKLFRPIARGDWKWFIAVALMGGLNQAPYFLGFKYLSIGTATLLFYAALVVGGYGLGKVFFAEKIRLDKWISLTVAVIGMLIIYGFALSPGQIFPASMTVLAGVMGACTVILPKKLIGNYHELQIMAGYFLMQVIFNYPLAQLMGDHLPALAINSAWGGQLAYAGAMVVANLAAIKGFGYLAPSVGSLIGLSEILFGVVFGVILFGEAVTLGVWLGGAMIIVAAALPTLIEMVSHQHGRSTLG